MRTKWSAAPLLITMVFGSVACQGQDTSERPNVVLILCDDMGYSDLGCYGGEIRTPNLDQLASDGLRFRQFYNNAKCTQTRASLLSGLYYHQSQNFKKANHVTLAEVLKNAGYFTMMVGKWHLEQNPVERGFDRYFGFLSGAINYYTGADYATGKNLMREGKDVYDVPAGFYSTIDFTDRAIAYVEEASQREQPFFLYLAYNAPHFPLHALPEDIDRYRGKYLQGWDRLRADRYARMKRLGVIEASWPLSPRDPVVPSWDSLDDKRKDQEDLLMAVYAAMVDRLDREIGRLLETLDRLELTNNTLVMFLSDNGACPYDFNRTPDIDPGPAPSDRSYNSPWANASNTPFRFYKQWCHEGGTATPFIARWPAGIRGRGGWSDQFGHLIDIMPTLVEVCEASYPTELDGHGVLPMEGRSLLPVLHGGSLATGVPYFWEFRGHHGVRQGRWKLVAESGGDWELYDIVADRTESHNLVASRPELADRLKTSYDAWSHRVAARDHAACVQLGPSTQAR